jgi:hypothetical protein
MNIVLEDTVEIISEKEKKPIGSVVNLLLTKGHTWKLNNNNGGYGAHSVLIKLLKKLLKAFNHLPRAWH